MKFGPLGVFDLTCFLAMGYDFFPGGGEKRGLPAGRRLREPGWAGTAQERCEACFSAARCDWEQLGFWPLGGRRRPNIFLFASGVLTKIGGLGCPFFVHFRPVLGLFGICRLIYIYSCNFPKFKISKELCLFRRGRPFPSRQRKPQALEGGTLALANIFPLRSKLAEKNRRSPETACATSSSP